MLCVVLMIGQSAALLMMPWLIGLLAEGFFTGLEISIGWVALGLVALFALQSIFQVLQSFVLTEFSQAIVADLRRFVYSHVQDLPLGFHLQHQRGSIISLVTNEIDRLSAFLTGPLISVAPQVVTLLGAIGLMVHLDPVLAFPIVVGVPLAALLSKLFGRRFRAMAGEWQAAYRRMIGTVESHLAMLPAIKSFVREQDALSSYARQVEDLRRLAVRTARRQALLAPIMSFAAATAVVGLLWISTSRIEAGALETREMVSFLLYAAILTRPVAGLANLWGQYQLALGSLERLDGVLSLERERFDTGQLPVDIRGDIEFENVGFTHVARDPVLRNISLHIPAGQTIALTGENGAGKTTLIELLLRFHSPDSGRILLDGQEIQDINLSRLRSSIGLVPQRAYLFDGTVRQNILFGKPEATEDELETAAAKAQALRFIRSLPQGFDTLIGDKGVKLSGGESQRVALARALIKDPPVLILDEPTAMFDPEGEAAFVANVEETFADRTVILITHRPASLALVDRVVVLGDGAILSDTLLSDAEPKASRLAASESAA